MDALNALSNRTAVTSAVKRVSPVVQMLVPAMGNARLSVIWSRTVNIFLLLKLLAYQSLDLAYIG